MTKEFPTLQSASAARRHGGRFIQASGCHRCSSFVIGCFLLGGCAPSPPDGRTPVESRLFSHVEVIGSRGVGAGQFNKPRSVAVDREDHLYVVDLTARVQKFSPDGRYLGAWQFEESDKGRPKGMGRDADGNIIVVEPHYCRVNHLSPSLKPVLQWGVQGTNAGQLAFPRAVAVNARGEIYVSEYMHVERVQRFEKPGGRLLGVFGGAGQGAGQFNRAEGLGIGSQGRVHVADSCNHRIQVFAEDGRFLRAFGKPGSGVGQFSYPNDVQVDRDGFQFVCEFGNSRVQVFDAEDRPVEILGGPGAAPDRMSTPWALTLDSRGNLYVADGGNHRVLKFVRKEEGRRHSGASLRHSVTGEGSADSRSVSSTLQ